MVGVDREGSVRPRAARQQIIGIGQRRAPIDVADCQRNAQSRAPRAVRRREGGPGALDRDLGARRQVGDRHHVDAAQHLLVQHRELPFVDGGLVGFAGGPACVRHPLQHPSVDVGFERMQHGSHRHRHRERDLDRTGLDVAEAAPCPDRDDGAGDRDGEPRGDERHGGLPALHDEAVIVDVQGIVGGTSCGGVHDGLSLSSC